MPSDLHIFPEFTPILITSDSLATVHEARAQNGQEVAVKVSVVEESIYQVSTLIGGLLIAFL